MDEIEASQLKEAVEQMHGGTAAFAQSVPIRENIRAPDGMGMRAAHLRPSRTSDRDDAGDEVKRRRGFMRLGMGLTVLWLVFWTCAYIISPPSSENAQSLPPPLSLATDIVLIAVAILGMPWVVSGFRPNSLP